MAFEVHSMTKGAKGNKNKDHVLWEEFVLKNNIKKKSSDPNVRINKLKYKLSPVKNDTVYQSDPGMRSSPFLENSKTNNLLKPSSPKIDIDLEKNKLRRIKSGKICIEGTIDLHGFSLKEAEKQLQLFVSKSYLVKKRLLLVITGKGRNSKPNKYGNMKTIKSEINNWLSDGFYHDKLQHISKALDKHGGDGAYYLFLRKSKNIFS